MSAIIENFQKKVVQVPIYFKNKKGFVIPWDNQKYKKQLPIIKNKQLAGLLREE